MSEDIANKADIITDTATGAIASFPDGSDGLPLKSLVASIEPVQDLHGYDSPWPAGGGANLINQNELVTTTGATYTVNGDTISISANGNANYQGISYGNPANLKFTPGTYYAKFKLKSISNATYFRAGFRNSTSYFVGTAITDSSIGQKSASWTITEDCYFSIVLNNSPGYENSAVIEDFIVSKTDVPFSPYSNECPISGWTGMNGQRTGVNVWDETYTSSKAVKGTDGSVATVASNVSASDYIPVKPLTEYYLNTHQLGSGSLGMAWYDADKVFISGAVFNEAYSNIVGAKTSPERAAFMRFTMMTADAGTNSINYPSTDTDYHAYTGENLSVSWQDTAGTVYGGSMTVNEDGSGELVATMAAVDMGAMVWNYAPSRFDSWLGDITLKSTRLKGLCEIYPVFNGAVSDAPDYSIIFSDTSKNVYVKDSSYNGDAVAFKAAMSGVQLVYELAEPLTYTFTDLTQLTTVLGTNNIWVDCGQTTAEYRADTKLYIDKKLAALVAALS